MIFYNLAWEIWKYILLRKLQYISRVSSRLLTKIIRGLSEWWCYDTRKIIQFLKVRYTNSTILKGFRILAFKWITIKSGSASNCCRKHGRIWVIENWFYSALRTHSQRNVYVFSKSKKEQLIRIKRFSHNERIFWKWNQHSVSREILEKPFIHYTAGPFNTSANPMPGACKFIKLIIIYLSKFKSTHKGA